MGIAYELLRFRTRDGDETTVYLVPPPARAHARGGRAASPSRRGSTTGAPPRGGPRRSWRASSCATRTGRSARSGSAGRSCEHEPIAAPWGPSARACTSTATVRLARRGELAAEPPGDLVQAGPLLVRDGRSADRRRRPRGLLGAARRSSTPTSRVGRHPRCALGVGDDELLAVCCDGRRSGVDAGLELAELARLLISFGARDAINLDGGGSATLVHRGHLLNRPVLERRPAGAGVAAGRHRAAVRAGVSRRARRLASGRPRRGDGGAARRGDRDGRTRGGRCSTPTGSPTARRRRCRIRASATVIADRVTDELVLRSAARPARGAADRSPPRSSGVVGGDAFASLFRRGVRDVHRARCSARPGHRHADARRRRHRRREAALRALDAGAGAAPGLERPRRVVLQPRPRQRDAATSRGCARPAALCSRSCSPCSRSPPRPAALALGADRRRTRPRLGAGAWSPAWLIVALRRSSRGGRARPRRRPGRPRGRRGRVGRVPRRPAHGRLADRRGRAPSSPRRPRRCIRPIEVEEPLRGRLAGRDRRAAAAARCACVRGVALVVAGVLVIAEPAAALRIAVTLARRLRCSTRAWRRCCG